MSQFQSSRTNKTQARTHARVRVVHAEEHENVVSCLYNTVQYSFNRSSICLCPDSHTVCVLFVFSLYCYRFLFVWRVRCTFFPSGWCFFYLVIMGCIFYISLRENSINQSKDKFGLGLYVEMLKLRKT